MRRACRRSMASENSTCMDRIFLKSVLDTHSSVDRKSTPSELQSHSDLVCRLLLEKKKPQDPLEGRYTRAAPGCLRASPGAGSAEMVPRLSAGRVERRLCYLCPIDLHLPRPASPG